MFITQYTFRPHYIVGGLFCILCVLCGVVWYEIYQQKNDEVLTVAFLDVGQGDAIYIETPHGNQVLIDGGKGMSVLRELALLMPFSDRSIDMVLATHPDLDHIEGLPEVFARYDVQSYVESGVVDDSTTVHTLDQSVADEKAHIFYARNTMRFLLDAHVVLHILFPDRDVKDFDTNTASIVAKLEYGDTSFLLTGDSPASIEQYLSLVYGTALKSDVLKLGHHGSRTSSSDEFLSLVRPQYAVASVGCDNTYGHPHAEVVERISQYKAELLNTCLQGTIVFRSDGKTVSVE